MREGYHRKAFNNIILNNSLHPHVWYPNSGDIFKNNIVSGAYRPAIMNRGIHEDGQWGKQLDSNLFITNEADRTKYLRNKVDSNSLVGDPLFVNPKNGDFRVRDNSPAFKIGFKSFPMNEFGVVSEKLKRLTKKSEIPDIDALSIEKEGKTYVWDTATVKNVETMEERSAAGLSNTQGVILVNVPGYSTLGRSGFQTGDVIVSYQGMPIRDFEHIRSILKDKPTLKELTFGVMHNQEQVNIKLEL